jgi:ABC-type phosphate transport system ATPase subunit
MVSGRMVELADTEAFFSAPQRPQTATFIRGDLLI